MNIESGVLVVKYKERSFRIVFNCKGLTTVLNSRVTVEEVKEPETTFFVKDNSESKLTDIEFMVLKSVAISFMFYTNDLMYAIKDFLKYVCDGREDLLNKAFLPGQTSTFISAIKNPNNINSIKETINMVRRNSR